MHALSMLAFVGTALALPTTGRTAKTTAISKRYADSYTMYYGDGAAHNGWPSIDQWGSFDQLWNSNMPILQNGCGWNNYGANNSPQEIADIKTAVNQASGESGIDARFIFATIIQESKGCVRAPTSGNGVVNPGLMQDHNGSGTCAGVNPCPYSEILQMVRDGTEGTAFGDGLQQTYAKAYAGVQTGEVGRSYLVAARWYNSGSVTWTNLNDGRGSTPCYVVDLANRLTGWTSLNGGACSL
ncbi:hypothetical protein G7046_g7583 [Stylonectria norvegica]|nr:hypothetical protein G7046_g7583 [Stylonectria norvegica]